MRTSVAGALAAALALLCASPAAARGQDDLWALQYAERPGVSVPERLTGALARLSLPAARFQALPMVVVRGDAGRVRRAARRGGALHAHRLDGRGEVMLDRSVPLVFGGLGPQAWAAGDDGRGVTVAVVDTGIDGTHPDLIDRVAANVLVATSTPELARGFLPGDLLPAITLALPCPGPCNTDTMGHGTHVAGTVAGSGLLSGGSHVGVAPGASLVGISISRSGTVFEFYALAGFDYLLAHPELGIDVINNSWGLNERVFDPTAPVNQASRMLHDRGITVVFSAGNSGPSAAARKGQPPGSSDCTDSGENCEINTNSVAPWLISVAAGARIDGEAPGGLADQHIADFSSRGDPEPHDVQGIRTYFQPDITAPGSGIIATTALASAIGNPAACPAVGPASRCTLDRDPSTLPFYTALSGTSMAAPHVAGAVAVLQSRAQRLMGRMLTPGESREMLVAGAARLTGTDGRYDNCGTDFPGEDEPCGAKGEGHTGKPYEAWQVGAGYLDIQGSLRALDVYASPAVLGLRRDAARRVRAGAKRRLLASVVVTHSGGPARGARICARVPSGFRVAYPSGRAAPGQSFPTSRSTCLNLGDLAVGAQPGFALYGNAPRRRGTARVRFTVTAEGTSASTAVPVRVR